MSDGVRHATPKEAEDLAFVRAVSWQVALEQGVIQGERSFEPYPTSVRRFQSHLEQSTLPVLVAVRDSKIVGYAALFDTTFGSEARTAELGSIHVMPAHWHDRVPKNLLEASESYLTRHAYRSVSISVRSDNAPVQHLLHERGFEMRDQEIRHGFLHTCFRLLLREP